MGTNDTVQSGVAKLFTQPTTAPRYLGFSQTQWRWAVKAWLALLPSLGFAWLFALLSMGHTLSHQPAWLFTVWAQLLVILALAALFLLLCLRSYILRTLPKLALEQNHQEHWRRQQATIHFDDATQ